MRTGPESPRRPPWVAVADLTAGVPDEDGGGGGGGNDNTSNTIEVMYAFSGGQEEGFKAEVSRAWADDNRLHRQLLVRPATSTS